MAGKTGRAQDWVTIGLFAVLGTGLAACGKSEETDSKVSANLSLKLFSATESQASIFQSRRGASVKHPVSALTAPTECSNTENRSQFKFQDGASGAPDLLKVKIISIKLKNDSGLETALYQSSDSSGTEISLTSGEVDLSGLVLSKELAAGEYTKIELTLADQAKVKGCIEGTYNGMYASGGVACGVSDATCEPWTDSGTFAFSFCTKTAHSIYTLQQTPSSTNSREDFRGTASEEMAVNLKRTSMGNNISHDPNGTADFTFTLPSAVAVSEGTALTISMVLDLNIFLKFDFNARTYANSQSGSEMYGDMTDKAFFSVEHLADVAMVFVGEPGLIEGYDVDICANAGGDSGSTATWARNWLTLIYSPTGALLQGMTRTYDPTGYVALNGTINGETATTRPSVKSGEVFTFNLGSGPGSGSLQGFQRISTSGSTSYISFGQAGTQTNMDASVLGSSNFDWRYTLRFLSSR